jgi:hypothetical protein
MGGIWTGENVLFKVGIKIIKLSLKTNGCTK